MARVVQRRSNPPYLLFFFLFLFLIAATTAIIFYNKWSTANDALATLQTSSRAVATQSDLSDPTVSGMLATARQPGQSPVVRQMLNRQANMAMLISGTATDPEKALVEARAILDRLEAETGLVALASTLDNQLQQTRQRASELEARTEDLSNQLDARIAGLEQASRQFQSETANLRQELATKQQELEALRRSINEQMGTLRTDHGQRTEATNRNLSMRIQQVNELEQQIAQRDARIRELLDQIEQLKPAGPGMQAASKPDGRVLRVQPDVGIAYINLGRRDRIRIGMPFEVYNPRQGITADGRGKGSLVVTNIDAGTAEVQITRWQATDPILEGDIIGNIAYDPQRTYTFVVEGEFDLSGDGRPDPMGQQRVKQMILEYGGRLVDQVSVDTDFVVMGTLPTLPPQPSETAPESTRALFRTRQQELQNYQAVQDAATALRIPVLNANRFLAFLGFTPEVLKY